MKRVFATAVRQLLIFYAPSFLRLARQPGGALCCSEKELRLIEV